MPRKITNPSGAIEIIDTAEEKQSKEKFKAIKKAEDLTNKEIGELVYEIAKKLNLL